jgi:spore maturation protein CgeB
MRKASKRPPVMAYHSHDNNFSAGILKPKDFDKTLCAYDLVFTTKSQNVPRYRELGQDESHFLASAFEPSIHHPIDDRYSRYSGQSFDVTFIGTYDRSRLPFLEKAGWNRVHVWGDHWKRFPEYRKLKSRIHPRAIYDFEFADVTSHSKCALGLLREEAEDLHTTRTFEIPACGALQIAPRNEELLSFFKEEEEIVCFQSAEELKDKLDFYLRNDFKRLQIARRGHERCLRDKHTYLDRVKEILGRVAGKMEQESAKPLFGLPRA